MSGSKDGGEGKRYAEPIAVVGMSCRFPSANNLSEFWKLMEQGKDAIGKVPANRWTPERCHILPQGLEKVEAGFLNVPVDEFDAKFFEVSPKEAAAMDPQHRLLMEVVWESFENAGINPQKLSGARGGVFLGSWLSQYKELLQLDTNESVLNFYNNYKGTCVGVGASRISQLLGWTGPCTGTESDCSAGLTSVSMACKSLQNGDCNVALACGTNIIVMPFTVDLLPAVLSPDFRCKTFDESANGFARGEGVGAVVLKRLSDAVRDGDKIWGVIRGSAVSQEGTNSSMGTPTVACQVEAMKEALEKGGVDPAQVSYVEAHGTGTPVGDFVEMSGISKVYCEGVEREENLIIGSVKTNVGHTEACSGLAGLIKVLLCMKKEVIPPHINFNKLNPRINLKEMKAKVPLELVSWRKTDKPRMAAVSSFGLAGKNCHVVLEEPPQMENTENSTLDRPMHILKVTAKTAPALEALLDKYADLFEKNSQSDELSFADLASSANGKADFKHRAAIIAEDHQSALKILKTGNFETGEASQSSKKICFLFTGQGSQYQGMAQKLYETSPVFKSHFDYCDHFLQSNFNFSVKETLFGKDENEVNRTLYSQTGIFVVEYALMKLWLSWGVKPSFVLGHSLGEFCAAVCAGILEVEDALKLVAHRSLLIDQLPPGKMLVVKGNKQSVEELQREFFSNNKSPALDYAAFNAEDQTVVAGCPETVLAFQNFIKNGKGVKCTLLQSSHAFHSKDMDPILDEYRKTAEKIQYKNVNDVIYISGMFGKAMRSEVDADYWVKHTRDPVNFLGACQALGKEQTRDDGNLICLELGPQPVLSSFVMMNGTGNKPTPLCLASLRKNADDWKTIFTSLGKLFTSGVEISWDGVDKGYSREKVGHLLPTYPFQRTKFWPKIPSFIRNQKRLHPLLGTKMSHPASTIVFQNEIPSTPQQLEYLKEHRLGERIIFPGAGYIEMMLAAGSAHFYDADLFPIQLKDVKMSVPLELNEDFKGERPTCQTILQADGENLKASIHHENHEEAKTGGSWIEHASASIYPQFDAGSVFNSIEGVDDLGNFLSGCHDENKNLEVIANIKSTVTEENIQKSLYKTYSTVGFNFGEEFQTLRKVWKCWDSRKFLAELPVPKSLEEEGDKYFVHPTIIDAMIQTVGFPHFDEEVVNGKKPSMVIPVRCKQFIWVKPLRTNNCFIYCPNWDAKSAVLCDGNGGVVALLYKLDTVTTTVDGIIAAMNTQHNSLPSFYAYQWDKIEGEARFDIKSTPDGVEFAKLASKRLGSISPEDECVQNDINKLASLYITKALIKLGWAPQGGIVFGEEQVFQSLGVLEQHQKLFFHYLGILEEVGLLEKVDAGNMKSYKITKPFPTLDSVESEISRIVGHYVLDPERVEYQKGLIPPGQVLTSVLQLTGPKLDKLLTGKSKESALSLLYPDTSGNKLSAMTFYEMLTANAYKTLDSLVTQHWNALKENFEKISGGAPLPTLRILEVGAGTGAGTVYLLESLEEAGLPFEYFYTDISSSFFPAAEKKFAKYGEQMKFKKLNLEQDPTSQGFAPGYFDVVLGVEVIHATRDIKETLCNLRKLMVDGGNLWMIETVERDWFLDCTFGLLDGFWRFTDVDLRPRHCMLSLEKWKMVTEQMGFAQLEGLRGAYSGILVCRADNFGSSKSSSKELHNKLRTPEVRELHLNEENHPKWIILYEEGETKLVTNLVDYFEQIGRKRIVLIKASKISEPRKENTFLNQLNINYSEVGSTCCKLLEDGAPIEGIIVTWGLSQLPPKKFQDELAKPYLDFLQSLINPEKRFSLPRVFLLTKGQYPSGDIVCPNPAPSTLIGMSCAATNEHKELNLRILDLDPGIDSKTSLWKAFQEMFSSLQEQIQRAPITLFREDSKLTPRFNNVKPSLSSLQLPSGRFQLVLPSSHSIQDLEFGPLPSFGKLKEDEVEVRVVCTGMNFRDVLGVLKPTPFFANNHRIGIDYSGVITQVGNAVKKWKPGDAVFGMSSLNQPLLSHVKDNEDLMVPLPEKLTFAEAASIPLVFCTVHYSLFELARVKKNDVLLIHAASGGVGLAGIQIAKELGLQLICTAGSERKRAYLRSLGIQNVFNSRTTEFSKQILEVTGGKGVDIVLNSLTSPGFKEATVSACKEGAHFIELSKLNIFTVEEMAQLRPDVKYSIIDPTQFEKMLEETKYISVVGQWVKQGKFRSIPYTRFDVGDIRDAMTYLQKAKHIGKVVISMPEMNKSGKRSIPLFNNRSSYLITGGLGGIGLEVCKYMVEEGARNLALVGRSPPTQETSELLENLKKVHNCKILLLQGDVGSLEDCHRIFNAISKHLTYPLRGVMHSAGTLSDGILENLTWEHFQKTFRSKVEGSWNLHELTKNLNLEHFVLYSSVSSKLVPIGQASHISACNFEDTLAHFRNSHGLPATTVNWGQWAEVGVAKDLEHKLVIPFNRRQGIQSLDKILRKNQSAVAVTSFRKIPAGALDFFPFMKRIVDKKLLQSFIISSGSLSSNGVTPNKISTFSFWEEYHGGNKVEGMAHKDKFQVCKKYIEFMLRNVLRLEQDDPINEDTDLSVLGMDSLMMIELVNLMQTTLGSKVTVPQALLKDSRTLRSLATKLVEVVEERWTEAEAPTLDEVREQSLIDLQIPNDIQQERPGSHVAPSQVKTLLLTGATGFVGSHLLKELLDSYPQLEKIYCLVRGKEPEKRLASVLDRNQISIAAPQKNRVQTLQGDFCLVNFGLPEEEYIKISKEVDGIFHLGARVNHAEYYRKFSGGDVRSVNVGGLLNILRFACKGKTKHVFYTSTLLTVAWLTGEDGRLQETWPTIERLTSCGTSMGYTISKMICELHLKQAVEELGVPVKVLRCCTFRGPTTSTKSFSEGTNLMRMILFGLKERMIPNEKTPINVMPVDIGAKIISSIAFNDSAPNEVFHVTHPKPSQFLNCLPQLAEELGVKVDIVAPEEISKRFLERCKQAKDAFDREGKAEVLRKALVYDLRLIHQDKNLSGFIRSYGDEAWEGGWKDCEEFWTSKKLQTFVPQIYSQMEEPKETLKRDIIAAINEGLLDD